MSTTVQSILFDKSKWTLAKAIKWLKEHDRVHKKVDETDKYYRFRQIDPDKFQKHKYATIFFGNKENGLLAVIGELKSNLKKNCACKKNPMEKSKMSMGKPRIITGKELVSAMRKVKKAIKPVKTFSAKRNRMIKTLDQIAEDKGLASSVCVDFVQDYPDGDKAKFALCYSSPIGMVALVHGGSVKTPRVVYMTEGEFGNIQCEFEHQILCNVSMEQLKTAQYVPDTIEKDNPHCNPHCMGMFYHNPPAEITDIGSFYSNINQYGRVFAGASVIAITEEGLKKINSNGSMSSVSPVVAFYVDLASKANLVSDSNIDFLEARKDELADIYDSAIKYLKGSKGKTQTVEKPESTKTKTRKKTRTSTPKIETEDVLTYTASDIKSLYDLAKEQTLKANKVTFDVDKLVDIMSQMDKTEIALVAKSTEGVDGRVRNVEKIVNQMIANLQNLLDTAKEQREEEDKRRKAEDAKKQAKKEAEKKEAERKKREAREAREAERIAKEEAEEAERKKREAEKAQAEQKDEIGDVIDQINEMILSSTSSKQLSLPQDLADIIDANKDEFAKRVTKLIMWKKRDMNMSKSISKKGSAVFNYVLGTLIAANSNIESGDADFTLNDLIIEYKKAPKTTTKKDTKKSTTKKDTKKSTTKKDTKKSTTKTDTKSKAISIVEKLNDMISKATEDSELKLSAQLKKDIQTNEKDLLSIITYITANGVKNLSDQLSKKGVLSQIERVLRNVPKSLKSGKSKDKFLIQISKSNPRRHLGHNRSYAYPMSVRDHNHEMYEFDMFKGGAIPNPQIITVDLLKQTYDLSDIDDKTLSRLAKYLDKEFTYSDLLLIRKQNKSPQAREISQMLMHHIDHFLMHNRFHSNPRRNALQPYQEPQVDVAGTMIDQDIYSYFGMLYGYIDLVNALEFADDDDIQVLEEDIEDMGDLVIEAQTDVVPKLETQFNEYIDEGGEYPLPKSNPYGRFSRYYNPRRNPSCDGGDYYGDDYITALEGLEECHRQTIDEDKVIDAWDLLQQLSDDDDFEFSNGMEEARSKYRLNRAEYELLKWYYDNN